MTDLTYYEKLTAHIELELKRYFPDLENLNLKFAEDEPIIMISFFDGPILRCIHQTSDNANASDADWFVFATDTGHVLTLPLFIEE